mmetsp:Transcript_11143/g.20322  ORF Transcript_11143/g.20322 Transcript_11143/m.20322 type:complete len:87 (+) Transcript_11143:75-335(+)
MAVLASFDSPVCFLPAFGFVPIEKEGNQVFLNHFRLMRLYSTETSVSQSISTNPRNIKTEYILPQCILFKRILFYKPFVTLMLTPP